MKLSLTQEEVRQGCGDVRENLDDAEDARVDASGGERVARLLKGVEADTPPKSSPEIRASCGCDSRKVQAGSLFFALHGAKADGNAFVREASGARRGGDCQRRAAAGDFAGEVGVDSRARGAQSVGDGGGEFFRASGDALKMAAVTGTNGKTTTTSLIDAIVKASGAKTGLFGTIAYHTPAGKYPAPNTTPESVDLQGFLAEIRDAGGRYAVLEASSHSLSLDRLWGCHFAAAVFTNLTREHMDYHKKFEDYFAAKRTLFDGTGAGAPDAAMVNIDDEYGKRLAGWRRNVVTYGLDAARRRHHQKISTDVFAGLTFTAQTPKGKVQMCVAAGRAHQRVQHSGGDWRGAGAGLIQRGDRGRDSESGKRLRAISAH